MANITAEATQQYAMAYQEAVQAGQIKPPNHTKHQFVLVSEPAPWAGPGFRAYFPADADRKPIRWLAEKVGVVVGLPTVCG